LRTVEERQQAVFDVMAGKATVDQIARARAMPDDRDPRRDLRMDNRAVISCQYDLDLDSTFSMHYIT
jgi:hypothetical protein